MRSLSAGPAATAVSSATRGVSSVDRLSTSRTWSAARSSGGGTNGRFAASSLPRSTAVLPRRSTAVRDQGQVMSKS